MASTISGEFLGEPGRRIFALLRKPATGRPQGCVLVVPPFGDEMNKSRSMVTAVAERLVAQGRSVLVPDLAGTGDSEGDFEEATVDRWQADLALASGWSESNGCVVDSLLGIRLGCALAAAAVDAGLLHGIARSAFWAPVLDGERHLTQFLRLRVAAAMMAEDRQETVQGLRARIDSGESIEVAGYCLAPALVAGLSRLRFDAAPEGLGRVEWFELLRDPAAGVAAAVSRVVQRWQSAGRQVVLHGIAGETFWSTVEICRVPSLVDETARALA